MADLLDTLEIESPILQAPMAGVSTPAMAAAVTNAGGLGAIGVGATDAAGARAMIAQTRALTTGSFNVNLFCHQPARADVAREAAWIARLGPHFARVHASPPPALREIYRSAIVDPDLLAVLLATKPRVVSFHFGVPSPDTIGSLLGAGITLLATATSLAEALALQAAGVDVIVAQGWEAGGHRGVFDPDAPDDRLGTLALTAVLANELRIPVIATGGIMDGMGIRAALALGACAAQLGTAFIACDESQADAGYRRALGSEAAYHTVITRAISGRPARCLPNAFTALGADVPPTEIPAYPIAYDAGKALHAAAKATGDFGYGAQWAGQGAPLARALPAAELVHLFRAQLAL